MRAILGGHRPSASVLPSAARTSVIGAAVLLSACASTAERRYAGAYPPPPQPVHDRGWTTEVEEDGKPAQVPPIRRMRPEEDDPTQPWSPNYGSREPLPPTVPAPRPTTWPRPIQTSGEAGLPGMVAPRRLAEAEAEAVIARAITAHETRKP
jgi:hypothetical protein